MSQDTNKHTAQTSIGKRIKKIREYRGLTQKELGLLCGFSESTADVRIAQYESNKNIPREKIIEVIANALKINKYALVDEKVFTSVGAIQTLFALEDFNGLHPVMIDGHIYLDFGLTYQIIEGDFLEQWYSMYKNCKSTASDSFSSIQQKKKEYDLWRYEYPNSKEMYVAQKNEAEQKTKKLLDELHKNFELIKSLDITDPNKDELLKKQQKILEELINIKEYL